jgi:biopolymer transport protein ExbD
MQNAKKVILSRITKTFINVILLNLGLFIILLIFLLDTSVISADKSGFQFTKQPAIQQVKQKKPVKIKLKRTADGKYTWDLTGDDADEIVRIDRRLRKLLKIE